MQMVRRGSVFVFVTAMAGIPIFVAEPVQPVQKDEAVSGAGATAAPLLLSLLKDLRQTAESGLAFEDSMSRWCQDAHSQAAGMEEDLRRQLDEASNEIQQVALDSKRLSSEASLVNSTTVEKEEQLKDAAIAVKEASSQYLSEKSQLQTMLEAVNHALQILETESDGVQQSSGSDHSLNDELVSNLLQLQHMADMTASGLTAGHSQAGGFHKMRAYQLKQTLDRLRSSLQSELSSAAQEDQEIQQKHWIFADHLNSSVMEIQSQTAAIKMQVAQRRGERIRLEARVGDLNTLIEAVTKTRLATEATCAEDSKQKAEVAEHVKAESFIVKSMLRQSPSAGGLGQADAPSFLQVRERSTASARALQSAMEDLESMAKRFPQEAAWYSDGMYQLSQLQVDAQARSPTAIEATRSPLQSPRTALQNIRQFVAANDGVELKAASHKAHNKEAKHQRGDEVAGLYSNLLGRVRAKEHAVEDQRGHCAALLRDAAVDKDALDRSLQRVDAKRRIAKAAMALYEQNAAYNTAQSKSLSQLIERLDHLTKDAGSLRARARDLLRGHAEELMALATDLSQQTAAAEQHTAKMVRDLAQKVDSHQKGLHMQYARLLQRKDAVDVADQRLLKLLTVDAERNRRRLVRLQAEEQLLAGVAFAKANDRELGAQFFDRASKLCSAEGLDHLDKKERELHREEQVLQASAQTGGHASARSPTSKVA